MPARFSSSWEASRGRLDVLTPLRRLPKSCYNPPDSAMMPIVGATRAGVIGYMTTSNGQITLDSRLTPKSDKEAVSWRKSSKSAYNGNCLEFAELAHQRVAVRDSKAKGDGPALVFTNAEWRRLVARIKGGELDFC